MINIAEDVLMNASMEIAVLMELALVWHVIAAPEHKNAAMFASIFPVMFPIVASAALFVHTKIKFVKTGPVCVHFQALCVEINVLIF
jgi:hypothetical protein